MVTPINAQPDARANSAAAAGASNGWPNNSTATPPRAGGRSRESASAAPA